jgi:hypothetical protein
MYAERNSSGLALAEGCKGREEEGRVERGEDYASDCEHPVVMSVIVCESVEGVKRTFRQAAGTRARSS